MIQVYYNIRLICDKYILYDVTRQVCGQTLGLGLVDRNRTVVIISLQWRKSM